MTGRVRRLVEELHEEGFFGPGGGWSSTLLVELDYALHPLVHERRVPSFGSIVAPGVDVADWEAPTELSITRRDVGTLDLSGARKFADGLSSFVVRHDDDHSELIVFDRPAGSERDLVVLAGAAKATIVQRHPNGVVRLVGDFGVVRWDGIGWHHEPPVSSWIDAVTACAHQGDRHVLSQLLEFAVHDLGARGIGALLVYRPDRAAPPDFEVGIPEPPPLDIRRPVDIAPLRHVLAQLDGASFFDESGILRLLGVRLVPSPEAETRVEGYRGMRHTAGRRYSYDDPSATVIVVSEDGPVTVLRNGVLLGHSDPW
jgi:hypothetical protein